MTVYSYHPTNIRLYDIREGVDLGVGDMSSDHKKRSN